ncbi:unnamed protein product [Psylliodes chrysocephalus]|uniref:Uncharacterized protein n=1 Tax=Psylliodes chrysocephalus TaxID=3402493 RepID=A0A9P0CLL1_9CUCU|nr:unnamed protein product [Psylliodes chrysocephala]
MKSIVIALAGTLPEKVIPILRQESEVGIDGRYSSSFETGNGIISEEYGTLKNPGTQNEAAEVVGRTGYQSPEGFPIVLEYIANEFGFQPKGDHLPVPPVDTNTPPPIPPAILRSLEYNAAHPEEDDSVQHQHPVQGQFRQESEVGIDGRYSSSFETGNGIKSEEQGTLKNAGTQNEAQEVVGKVEYQSPEGFPIFLEYLANELGFQAKGDHLPVAPVDTNTPPPIPPAILRALEYNAAHPEEDDSVQHQAQGQFSP